MAVFAIADLHLSHVDEKSMDIFGRHWKGHWDKIQQAWRSRDIALQGSGLSLVTVYAHSVFEDVRFVTHAGVLAETEEGLLFVERYSPEAPFQATRFQNRAQLKEYLLARPDLYGEKKELPPIVMENGEPLAA